MIKMKQHELFYGSQEAFDAIKAAVDSLKTWARVSAENRNTVEFQLPKLYNRQGDVGIIDVKGTLINGSSGFLLKYGITGYDDLQAALIEGIRDKKAKRLVFAYDTQGGMVKGLKPFGDTLLAAREVKPTTAYIEAANSAGYWLASTASRLIIDEMGEAGSIGCITVHTEYSKALEKEGVTKTAIRAGENKSLYNNFEPLSPEAREVIQQGVNKARDHFVKAVAEHRGVTAATVESQYGQGKIFTGSDAVSAGLVDAMGSMTDAMAYRR